MSVGTLLVLSAIVAAEIFASALGIRGRLVVLLAGTLGALASAAYPFYSIRCPSCGAKWFWMVANSKGNAWRWYDTLRGMWRCPSCERTCDSLCTDRMSANGQGTQ
jgi:hypothetical protein